MMVLNSTQNVHCCSKHSPTTCSDSSLSCVSSPSVHSKHSSLNCMSYWYHITPLPERFMKLLATRWYPWRWYFFVGGLFKYNGLSTEQADVKQSLSYEWFSGQKKGACKCNYVVSSEAEFHRSTGGPTIAVASYVLKGGKWEIWCFLSWAWQLNLNTFPNLDYKNFFWWLRRLREKIPRSELGRLYRREIYAVKEDDNDKLGWSDGEKSTSRTILKIITISLSSLSLRVTITLDTVYKQVRMTV